MGLRSDGNAVAVGFSNVNLTRVGGWRNITAIAAGEIHTAGLRSDGFVLQQGEALYGQFDLPHGPFTAVAAGAGHTVALRSDGTVAAAGNNFYGQCDVKGWTDIRQPNA